MLARDTGVPVIALSALNEPEADDAVQAPTLGDLPMGEHIGEFSNLVLLLHRDAELTGSRATKAIIAPNTRGKCGTALL